MLSKDIAVEIDNVSKKYFIFKNPLSRMYATLFKTTSNSREVNALKNVQMRIPRGKTIGIIGQNGSGKSTLLQIITGIINPSQGNVTVNGKIAALLELGSGFNPEFTGRENVYMNATLLGLTNEQIHEKFDDILNFAEIGDFIDQPVKTYSSGMFLRLAFATAVHTDPEILIVDEALAVGDVRFQNKCFRKFKEFQQQGKTILFVTHATELLIRHCDYAYLINKGELIEEGQPKDIVNTYLDLLYGKQNTISIKSSVTAGINGTNLSLDWANDLPEPVKQFVFESNLTSENRRSYNKNEYRWGDKRAEIIDYLVISNGFVDPVDINSSDYLEIYMKVKFHNNINNPIYGLTIKTIDGVTVYGTNTRDGATQVSPKFNDTYSFVKFKLTPKLIQGDYFISLGVAEDVPGLEAPPLDRRYDLIHLKLNHNTLAFGITDIGMEISELN
ncbi:ABC transporter ATP-binding protein [Paenibacillus polysaccharolyticus]|uniref:ABC transporter ATP-binding protein n=1 Tax=Paenibacillus polysaccharolyticus TaxID=582692 RepID=UPI00280A6ACE|nr:ABC transporter ATP-binding protein [Paenibacillus polysaccharolyticus]